MLNVYWIMLHVNLIRSIDKCRKYMVDSCVPTTITVNLLPTHTHPSQNTQPDRKEREGERERQRQRQRERDRETERDRDRERETETERDREDKENLPSGFKNFAVHLPFSFVLVFDKSSFGHVGHS